MKKQRQNKVDLFSCTQPCSNCPYRKDAPVKMWHYTEFIKLIKNEQEIIGHVFKCHKNNGSICIGWLIKQDENRQPCNALRIALAKHEITRQYLSSLKSPSPLYETIQEMIKANYPELLTNTNG